MFAALGCLKPHCLLAKGHEWIGRPFSGPLSRKPHFLRPLRSVKARTQRSRYLNAAVAVPWYMMYRISRF
jgi:hypothetical protein